MEVLRQIVAKMHDELYLFVIGVLVLAVIAGLEDATTVFIAALVAAPVLAAISWRLRQQRSYPIALNFEGTLPTAEIRLSECKYELRDDQNNLKRAGKMAFCFEVNSWVCYLPRDTLPTDIVRIYIRDGNGERWETTKPFRPLYGKAVVEQVS